MKENLFAKSPSEEEKLIRADLLMVKKGLARSRGEARELIEAKRVLTPEGDILEKAARHFAETAALTVAYPQRRYVSRGGYKLEAALAAFSIHPADKVCLDIGASTGGFTQCLLYGGAKKVYAVDIGTRQLHPDLKDNPKVISWENTDARLLNQRNFDEEIDLIVMDVSFVSQTLFYPAAGDILSPLGKMVTLVKPQFELGSKHAFKNGVVKDPLGRFYSEILKRIKSAALQAGLSPGEVVESPLKGGDGNREYLTFFTRH